MTGFPYPPTESYPQDEAHLQYLREYNTRIVKSPTESLTVGSLATWVIVVVALIAVVDTGVLAYFKKRKQ